MFEFHIHVANDVLRIEGHEAMLLPVIVVLIGQASWHRGCPWRGALVHIHLFADGVLIAIRLAESLWLIFPFSRLNDSAHGRLNRHLVVAVVHQSHVTRSIVGDFAIVILCDDIVETLSDSADI